MLAQLLQPVVQLLLPDHILNRPLLARDLLSSGKDLLLAGDERRHKNVLILRLLRLLKRLNNRTSDLPQVRSNKLRLSPINQRRRLRLTVNPQERHLEPPVKERSRNNARPADLALLALQVIDDSDLRRKNRDQGVELVVRDVGAVFGREETLHSSGDGGVDYFVLVTEGGAAYEGEDGIGAFKGVGERIEGLVVSLDDFDSRWECGFAAFAG